MKTNRINPIRALLATAAALIVNLAPTAPAAVISHWRMEAQMTTTETCFSGTRGVADAATSTGQGTLQGSCTGVATADDPLITFNGNGDTVSISSTVPPANMFNSGFSGGSGSYNAEAIASVDGALFFAQDRYGDEFTTASWTFEMFIKANGNQSGGGFMQLMKNDEVAWTYGLVLNESSAGGLRLFIYDGSGFPTLDLTDRNYADGQWHYIVCSYDTVNNKLTIRVRSEDGQVSKNFKFLSNDPVAGAAGNLFLGRNTFNNADRRTFRGLMDEVRISDNVVADDALLGKINPDGTNAVAHWRFESTLTSGDATNWARFQDYATGTGQGTGVSEKRNGHSGGVATRSEDYLNIFPGDAGVTLSNTVPPAAMFNSGFSGGVNSYNVQSSSSTAVFVPDRFGDELNTPSWTWEMFYKANGNQAGSNTDEGNRMQLMRNGEWYSGLVANESAAGGLRLFVQTVLNTFPSVDLNDRNYSDGTWQYIVCTYHQPTKTLTIRVRSENGLVSSNSVIATADPITTPGNFFFGTVDAGGARRVRGLMDEIRFSDGVQANSSLMGLINADSTNVVTSSLNPALPASSITFTSAVSAVAAGNGTPTGTVQFKTNGVALGGSVALVDGVATVSTSDLPAGSHTVTAEYAGDDTFYGSTNSMTQIVNTPPVAKAVTTSVALGGTVTIPFDLGKYTLATDADGDSLTITSVGSPDAVDYGSAGTDGSSISYTNTSGSAGVADVFSFTVSDGMGGLDTNTVTVHIDSPQGYNRLSPPDVIGPGTVALSYLGIPGENYALDHATNLTPPIVWMPVITNTASTNGRLNFTNTSSATENYFRTRHVP